MGSAPEDCSTVYYGRAMRFSFVRISFRALVFLFACSVLLFKMAAQSAPDPNPQLSSKALNARVESLLKKMTLEEKIGQMVQYSAGYATGPNASNLKYDELVQRGKLGSMLNVVGAEATNHYQHIAMEKSRLHIPILFGQDVIHGHRTIFPVPLALAASWDPQVAETVART
jgi:beta-glucosidase